LLSGNFLASFQHSEWEWQRRSWMSFPGQRRAEGIERVIFFCPACGTFRSVIGKGNVVLCLFCGARWPVDEYGFIGELSQQEFAEDQNGRLASFCENMDRIVLPGGRISERTHPEGILRRFFFGPVIVEREGIRLHGEFFLFSQIRGENTFLKRVLEFTAGKRLIRIHTEKDAFLLWSILRLKKQASLIAPEASLEKAGR
ncbi:MAG: hypothetical protein ACP5Q4_09150, partial [Candidatus Caldatribacteriaceae bacterium]